MTNDSNKRGNKRLNNVGAHFPMPPDVEETIRVVGAGWCDDQLFHEIWAEIDRLRTEESRLRSALEAIAQTAIKSDTNHHELLVLLIAIAKISLEQLEQKAP